MSSHRVLPPIQNIFPDIANNHFNGEGHVPQYGRIMNLSFTQAPEHRSPQDQFGSLASTFNPSNEPALAVESHQDLRSDGFRISRRRTYTFSDVFQDADRNTATPTAITSEDERRDSATIAQRSVSPRHVCLCQPDPKVPRPRNSFILFRQHHQAEVAKSNPGLANPEISKIIGEYWRNADPGTKEAWKNLAEEEKARHQKQYPEYRYQPKRPGRSSQSTSSSAELDIDRCPKCGGRSIQSQRSQPLRPREDSSMAQTRPTPARLQHSSPPSTAMMIQEGPNQYPRSPRSARFAPHVTYAPVNYGAVPNNGAIKNRALGSPIMSPEAKRHRFDSTTNVPPSSRHSVTVGTVGKPLYDPSSKILSSPSLPRSDYLSNHSGFAQHRAQAPMTHTGMTLAPINIGNPSAQSRSVEAMVMSIAALKKVRTLAKISKPLPMSHITSPPYTTRGAIVSVEGTDDEALKAVIMHVRNRLQQANEYRVRLYYGGSFVSKKESPSFSDWLKVIQSWHKDAHDVKNFITSSQDLTPHGSPMSDVSPKTCSNELKNPIVARNLHSQEQLPPISATDKPVGYTGADAGDSDPAKKRKASDTGAYQSTYPVPVAVIPRYQLTLTDIAASFVPISDGYSPVDHWQWMAATWRGVPGPDVTIIVRPHAPDDSGEGKIKGSDVEVRLVDFNTVILRYEKGGKITDSSLRRVGFEVEEWLRGMAERSWKTVQADKE